MADFQNEYSALPGHMNQFKDSNRALREDPTPANTDSILLIGTATDGPVMQPFRVTPNTASIFGKMVNANGTANGSTLLAKFEETWASGARDIRLMRVTGKPASLSLKGTPYTETKQEVKVDQLGISQGNGAITFTLPHGGINPSSVIVKANGAVIATTEYVVTPGVAANPNATVNPEVKATIALDADVTDMKSDINVTYSYTYQDAVTVPAGAIAFTLGEEKEFDIVTDVQPADAGKMVRGHFTIPTGVELEYYDTVDDKWYPMTGVYGPVAGFAFTDAEVHKFRGTFSQAGESIVEVEYREVGTDDLVQLDEIKGFAVATKTAQVIDNNTDATGSAMIANGADKSFDLTQIAKAGLKLYADGAEVTDTTVYTVDSANKKLIVKNTAKIKRGQLLEASYGFDVTSIITPTIELDTAYGGNVYNDTKAKVEIDTGVITISITKPESKKSLMSEPAMMFRSTDFPSFQLMCNAINTHSYNNNVVIASTSHLDAKTNTLEAKPDTFFSGGDDELFLSKEEMYKRLGGERNDAGTITQVGAYQLLENYNVDVVVPLGVYADDVLVGRYDNFAYQLALACAVMSHYGTMTHGTIATSSPQGTTLAEVEDHVQKILAQPNTFYMRDRFGAEIKDGEGERLDIGQFISVVAGPDIIVGNTRLGTIATTGVAALEGMVSQLRVQSAPTNKVIPNALGLRFEYSASQLNRLTQARFITFKIKGNNGAVAVVDAMTAAHAGSDYQRRSTSRIVKTAVDAIKEVSDPFLGEPNDTQNRNALAAAISKRLDKMKEDKQLLGFDFQIVATSQMELMGEAQIELGLQAPNELRRLTTIVSLT